MAHHGDAKQLAEYHAKYPQCYDEPAKNLGAAYLELAAEVEALNNDQWIKTKDLMDAVRVYGCTKTNAEIVAMLRDAAMKAPA